MKAVKGVASACLLLLCFVFQVGCGANGDCKLDCVSAYIPLGDKPDETIRNRSLRSQSGERH